MGLWTRCFAWATHCLHPRILVDAGSRTDQGCGLARVCCVTITEKLLPHLVHHSLKNKHAAAKPMHSWQQAISSLLITGCLILPRRCQTKKDIYSAWNTVVLNWYFNAKILSHPLWPCEVSQRFRHKIKWINTFESGKEYASFVCVSVLFGVRGWWIKKRQFADYTVQAFRCYSNIAHSYYSPGINLEILLVLTTGL